MSSQLLLIKLKQKPKVHDHHANTKNRKFLNIEESDPKSHTYENKARTAFIHNTSAGKHRY